MAKDKTGKLPKRIAGVKLPKSARKQANKAIAALDQPMVRDGLAALLAMAAAAAKRRAEQARADIDATPTPPPSTKAGVTDVAGHKGGGAGQLVDLATGLAVAACGHWLEQAAAKPAAAAVRKPT